MKSKASDLHEPNLGDGGKHRAPPIKLTKVRVAVLGSLLLVVISLLLGLGSIAGTPTARADETASDMPTLADWDNLAKCEAGGNWKINSGNGYYGGLQFNEQTWKTSGGKGMPQDASREEQIKVAEKLWRERGWQPWGCVTQSKIEKPMSIQNPTSKSKGSALSSPSTTTGDDSAAPSTTEPAPSTDQSDDSGSLGSGDDKSKNKDTNGDGKVTDEDKNAVDLGGAQDDGQLSQDALDKGWASPLQYAVAATGSRFSKMSDACEFLVFCRYQSAAELEKAQVSGLGDMTNILYNAESMIAEILFMLALASVWLIGCCLIWALSIDILSQGMYMADYTFFKIGSTVFRLDFNGSTVTMVGTGLLYSLVGATILTFLIKMLSGRGGDMGRRSALRSFVFSMALVGGIFFMTMQAAHNHPESEGGLGTSQAAAVGQETAGKLFNADETSEAQKLVENPSNWAILSPGWLVSQGMKAASSAGSVLNNLLFAITTTVTTATKEQPSQCDIYVNGMHAVFDNTQAAHNSGSKAAVLVSFDNMVNSLIYKSWAAASLGQSDGAQNAWCRLAEMQTDRPAGQQAMIARVSGLYSEVVGTGGLGFISKSGNRSKDLVANPFSMEGPDGDGLKTKVSAGSMVGRDGQWTKEGQTYTVDLGVAKFTQEVAMWQVAQNYFGPRSSMQNTAAYEQAKYYFAGCYWEPGGGAKVNPEWKNVKYAQGGDGSKTFQPSDCTGDITSGKPGKGFGERYTKDSVSQITSPRWNFSFGTSAVIETGGGEEYQSKCGPSNPGACIGDLANGEVGSAIKNVIPGAQQVSDAADTISHIFDSSPKTTQQYGPNFASAQSADGTNPSFDYLKRGSGYAPGGALVLSFAVVIVTALIVRYFGPVVVGSIVAQGIALFSFVFAVLGCLLSLLPIPPLKRFAGTMVRTVAAAMIVTSVVSMLFMIMFSISEVMQLLFVGATSSYTMKAILRAGAVILSFYVFAALMKALFHIDVTNVRGAMQLGMMSGSPVLRNFGVNAISPIDPALWSWGKRYRNIRKNERGDSGGAVSEEARSVSNSPEAATAVDRQFGPSQEDIDAKRAKSDAKRKTKRSEQDAERQRVRSRNDKAFKYGKDALVAADAAIPGTAAFGEAAQKAHSIASNIWRPMRDSGKIARRKTGDLSRGLARKLENGGRFTWREAQMMYAARADNPAAERLAEQTAAALPRMRPRDLARGGFALPNEDNINAFLPVAPGVRPNVDAANAVSEAETGPFLDQVAEAGERIGEATAAANSQPLDGDSRGANAARGVNARQSAQAAVDRAATRAAQRHSATRQSAQAANVSPTPSAPLDYSAVAAIDNGDGSAFGMTQQQMSSLIGGIQKLAQQRQFAQQNGATPNYDQSMMPNAQQQQALDLFRDQMARRGQDMVQNNQDQAGLSGMMRQMARRGAQSAMNRIVDHYVGAGASDGSGGGGSHRAD